MPWKAYLGNLGEGDRPGHDAYSTGRAGSREQPGIGMAYLQHECHLRRLKPGLEFGISWSRINICRAEFLAETFAGVAT